MNALQYVLAALAAIEQLAQAGASVMALVSEVKATVTAMQAESRDPTDDEWAALNAQIKAELDKLNG